MNCLFVSFVVTIQLEWFQSRVFIKKFWVKFDEPLSSTVAVEGYDVLLSKY